MHLPDNTLLQGGKYKITRFIASGGFGCTYEGVHTMLETKVAIKEFFPKMFCNRDENTSHVSVATQGNRDLVAKLRKKFNEEAIAVFRMKHDNIVRVLDVFEENGTAYYVMEYVDGKSLNDIVKERGGLPESEAVGYIRQVADALKYVHSLNRLHLDIKPGNIMIDKNGKAILIDFGASKHYDDESGENTSTLLGVNTKGYAPIEQSTQGFSSFSPATDIYALGATLYKLLTGITPPDANLLLAEEEKLRPLPSNVSYSTKHVVSKALQLRRKDRPKSITEFLEIIGEQEVTPDEETLMSDNNQFHQTSGANNSNSNGSFVSDDLTHKISEPKLTILWDGIGLALPAKMGLIVNGQTIAKIPIRKPYKEIVSLLPNRNEIEVRSRLFLKDLLAFDAEAGKSYTLHLKYSHVWGLLRYIITDDSGLVVKDESFSEKGKKKKKIISMFLVIEAIVVSAIAIIAIISK